MKTFTTRVLLASAIAFAGLSGALPAKAASHLVEPGMTMAPAKIGPRVALTFDACSGKVDDRILDALIDNKIAATIFVTGRWLKHNPEAIARLKAHPDLFEIENHGAMHVPAVDVPVDVYGIRSAGSPAAVLAEVEGGTAAMLAAGLTKPVWYRGATARYSTNAIAEIEKAGYRLGFYSLNGDGGSLLGASTTQRRIAGARDGDVILMHINQPGHPAGKGVVAGILALKAKGYSFVTLDQGFPPAF